VSADPIETYKIVPGDVLTVDGGKNPTVTKEVRVDEQGFINLIYLGKVEAAGKTKSEVENEVDAAYEEAGYFTDSQVSITVITLFYYMDGHVRQRGRKRYMRQMTLYQAIVDAGGFTEYANQSKVRVLRPQPDGEVSVYVINCRRIIIGRDPDTFVVRPNDTIFVPRGY
jgi:polysaccharide export outer membrane protein